MELLIVLLVFVILPLVFFVGGVFFGRRHQARIDRALKTADRLKEVARGD